MLLDNDDGNANEMHICGKNLTFTHFTPAARVEYRGGCFAHLSQMCAARADLRAELDADSRALMFGASVMCLRTHTMVCMLHEPFLVSKNAQIHA